MENLQDVFNHLNTQIDRLEIVKTNITMKDTPMPLKINVLELKGVEPKIEGRLPLSLVLTTVIDKTGTEDLLRELIDEYGKEELIKIITGL